MALMAWREKNQAKWIGVRPAHNGTQVSKSADVQNATATIHTVTTGKTFYFCGFTYDAFHAAASTATLYITDAADTVVVRLIYGLGSTNNRESVGKSYWPPLEVPAGYKIKLTGDNATSRFAAHIHGWEE